MAKIICSASSRITKAITAIVYAVSALVSGKEEGRALCTDERGEAYIGEAVKILIAVVIGGLLLTLVYSLMKDTVFPTVTQKIQAFFGYTG